MTKQDEGIFFVMEKLIRTIKIVILGTAGQFLVLLVLGLIESAALALSCAGSREAEIHFAPSYASSTRGMNMPALFVKAVRPDGGKPVSETYVSIFADIYRFDKRDYDRRSITPVSTVYLLPCFLFGLFYSLVIEDRREKRKRNHAVSSPDPGKHENGRFYGILVRLLGTESRVDLSGTGFTFGSFLALLGTGCMLMMSYINGSMPWVYQSQGKVIIRRSLTHDSRQYLQLGGHIDGIDVSGYRTHAAVFRTGLSGHATDTDFAGPARREIKDHSIVFIETEKGTIVKEIFSHQVPCSWFLDDAGWISEYQFAFSAVDTVKGKSFYLFDLKDDRLKKLKKQEFEAVVEKR
jgi:hypothetical protein